MIPPPIPIYLLQQPNIYEFPDTTFTRIFLGAYLCIILFCLLYKMIKNDNSTSKK
jgi:hypothetical protein